MPVVVRVSAAIGKHVNYLVQLSHRAWRDGSRLVGAIARKIAPALSTDALNEQ